MPTRNLKIALMPHDIVVNDPVSNLDIVVRGLKEVDKDTDLVVLPELFTTAFTTDLSILHKRAEPVDGPTVSRLRELSKLTGMAIWGSFSCRTEDDRYVNRGFMIDPEHEPTFYDKRHLFSLGGENHVYSPGQEAAPIVKFRTWNLKMAICYDIRFPVWNRNIANGYDALIVPANWAHARVYAWRHMLIARAIENQCYVAGCNREGTDDYGEYPRGDSFIFNYWGKDIADYRDNGLVYGTLDATRMNRDRERFAPWRDADKFAL